MTRRESAAGRGLPAGLYEQVVTRRLAAALEAVRERVKLGKLDPAEAPNVLAAHVADVLRRTLAAPGLSRDVDEQIALTNRLVGHAAQMVVDDTEAGGDAVERAEMLLAVLPDNGLIGSAELPRPETPIAQDALLVHAPHEPNLAAELKREIASADRIDLLCAFVVWSGIRVLLEDLRQARSRGVPIRVITTTYTGTTDLRSLQELESIGAEIRVSYDTRATRLHAKAWLFERDTGFSTAYVGSSNLTHSALHEGLEWNVRLAQASSPGLLERFRAAFATYWADPHFEPFEAQRFSSERQRQRTSDAESLLPWDIRPFPYQEEMLHHLEAERKRHNRWRNLLVAATGTGKTVVSAFDYRRLAAEWGGARLLFIAHREEILQQSRRVFRTVLHQGDFGELLVGGDRPEQGEHVFASVQSLSRMDLAQIRPDAYDMVIVDEFHRAEAPTYRRLLEHLRPKVLLGMTATPERTDPREDVTQWFGGHVAYELRLWDALAQGLLCPFQYFGVADDVSLKDVEWRRRGYDVQSLSKLYTGNDARAAKVVEAVRRYVLNPCTMRALGFCVSVEHAHFMAQRFNQAGIPALALSGASSADERRDGLNRLRQCDINVVFSVDLFNEGLDVPEIDTVLLLRPTESATVFLQQLGRGLRFAPGKSGLTVLDLIGQQHRSFRFEPRFAALTRLHRAELIRHIEAGFPYLPSGCSIQLDRVAQLTVLENVRSALRQGGQVLADELRRMGRVTLAQYLQESGRSLDEVYRSAVGGWSRLQRLAGFPVPEGPDSAKLERSLSRMHHVDDEERLSFYGRVLAQGRPPRVTDLSERERRLLTMLHFDLWDRDRQHADLPSSLERLWEHTGVRDELRQLLDVLDAASSSLGRDAGLEPEIPLVVHQRYTRNEILAALGEATVERPPSTREGVFLSQRNRADVFFVTLRKAQERFSPTTMYHDYAISSTLFHWESQSTTSEASRTGQRYIHHEREGQRILLFAREANETATGITVPYLFLGTAHYVSHRGSRPMAITWQLDHALPPDFYQEARAVA